MIIKIAVRNFQSLAAVTIELGRVTVVTGHSDSGKTALLRAIEAAAFNESAFDSVTSVNGQEATKMTVAFQDEECTIIWDKTKTSTTYRVVRPGVDPVSFNKMGRAFVPDEVRNMLGFRELQIDKNIAYRLQFASQHDSPFLILDRGGVFASRVLGRLTGVNVLSHANKKAKADKDSGNELLRQGQMKVAIISGELLSYAVVEDHKNHLMVCRQKLDRLKQQQNQVRELDVLVQRWLQTNKHYRALLARPQMSVSFELVEQGLQNLWNALAKWEQLKRLEKQWAAAKSATENSQYQQLLAIGEELDNVLLQNLWEDRKQLLVLQDKWVKASQAVKVAEAKLTQSDKEWGLIELECIDFEAQFPLCPWQKDFPHQTGVYRCADLMRVVQVRKQSSPS